MIPEMSLCHSITFLNYNESTNLSVKFAGANGASVSRGSAPASRAGTPPLRVPAPAVDRAWGPARGVSAPPSSSSNSRLAPTAAPHKPRPLLDLAGKDLSKLPEWQRRLLEKKLKVRMLLACYGNGALLYVLSRLQESNCTCG